MPVRPEHIPERFKSFQPPRRNDNHITNAMFVDMFRRMQEEEPELIKEVFDTHDADDSIDLCSTLNGKAGHPFFSELMVGMTAEEFADPTKFDAEKVYAHVHQFVKGMTERNKLREAETGKR